MTAVDRSPTSAADRAGEAPAPTRSLTGSGLREYTLKSNPAASRFLAIGRARRLRIENDDEEGLPELLRAAFAAIDPVLAPGAPIYLFCPAGPASVYFTDALAEIGWKIRQGLVWVKDSMVLPEVPCSRSRCHRSGGQ